jgi:hypothetical protein
MAALDDDGDPLMALMVKMSTGDVERFDTSTHWATLPDGGLRLFMGAEPPVVAAEFPSGAWLAVFEFPPRAAPVADCGVKSDEDCTVHNWGGGPVHVHNPKWNV